MKRALATIAAFCALPALGVAALAMYAAWHHNAQGEFHELGPNGVTVIHVGWWLLGIIWFGAIFVPLLLIGGAVTVLGRRWQSRPPSPNPRQ